MALLDDLKKIRELLQNPTIRRIAKKEGGKAIAKLAPGVSRTKKQVDTGAKFVRELSQQFPRTLESARLSAEGKREFVPTTESDKRMFGTRPVKSFGLQQEEGSKFLTRAGIPSRVASPLAGIGVAGLAAADIADMATPGIPEGRIARGAVGRITSALEKAAPIRNKQEALFSAERAKRAARAAAAGGKAKGEKAFFAQLGELKGELPKASFESVRDSVGQADIDELFDAVEKSAMPIFNKITAKKGLAKLLGAQGGAVPTRGELSLLNEVFPKEFVDTVLSKRDTVQKLTGLAEEALNVPRAMMATADLSAPLRQGVFLVGRPKQWIPAFKDMFKFAAREDAYVRLLDDIKARPSYGAMKESGLSLTDMSPILTSREEAFMTTLPEKLPVFGKLAKASNRAYSGFLNKLRADVFDDLYSSAKGLGIESERPGVARDIAKYVNAATGRGDLGSLNRSAATLNGLFFSPRLLASRLNLMNPTFYMQLDPFARKAALSDAAKFVGAGLSVLGMAKLAGAEVGDDPRNSDFGKIKIDDTRYDIWGGFQQPAVLIARLITNEMVSATTGREIELGEGFRPTTRASILGRFVESKEAPVTSFLMGMLKGKNFMGDDFDAPAELVDRFIPMLAQDVNDLSRHGENPIRAVPGVFGVGTQTFGKQIPFRTTTPTGKESIKFRPTPSIGEALLTNIRGEELTDIPEEEQQVLVEEKEAEVQRDIKLDKVKSEVMETSIPQRMDDTYVYRDEEGVLKTIRQEDGAWTPGQQAKITLSSLPLASSEEKTRMIESSIDGLKTSTGKVGNDVLNFAATLRDLGEMEQDQIDELVLTGIRDRRLKNGTLGAQARSFLEEAEERGLLSDSLKKKLGMN